MNRMKGVMMKRLVVLLLIVVILTLVFATFGCASPNDPQTCPACGGSGVTTWVKKTSKGYEMYNDTCTYCLGKGIVSREKAERYEGDE